MASVFSDISLDFKLLFLCFIVTGIFAVWGKFLSGLQETVALSIIFCVLAGISVRHKFQHNWRWPGVTGTHIRIAITNVIKLGAFLLLVNYVMGIPSDFYFFLGVFALFGILLPLQITTLRQEDFLAACHPPSEQSLPEDAEPEESEEKKKRIAASFKYLALFFLPWWLFPIPLLWAMSLGDSEMKDPILLTSFVACGAPAMYYWTKYQIAGYKIWVFWFLAPLWIWLPMGLLMIKLGLFTAADSQ